MIKKNKANSFSKINAIALVVGIALIGIATYAVFNKPADAQITNDGEVTISVKGGALNTFLSALGFGGGEEAVGGASGPDKYDTQYFFKGYTVGRDVTATSTESGQASITATSNELDCAKPYVSWTANLDQTITTQASTSAPFINLRPGESCSIIVYSATTTAGTTMTWAAGTGIDLQEDEGETVIQNGLEIAELKFTKKADTNVVMWVRLGQVGD